jgi:hypothetical protein
LNFELRGGAAALWITGLILVAGSTAINARAPSEAPSGAPVAMANSRAAGTLHPFSATYAVLWNGITAGTASLDLTREGADRFVYRSRIEAGGIFHLVFPDDILQASTFMLEDGGLRTLEYHASDGDKERRRDINLTFDWHVARITGLVERRAVDIPLRPGTLDPMSVQIAMIRALESGGAPTHFLMVDKNEIKDYVYAPEGAARIHTTLGELDTVIWSSSRPDSDRVTRMWYAPSLGFIPVRAEQSRAGKVQVRMTIRSIKRT